MAVARHSKAIPSACDQLRTWQAMGQTKRQWPIIVSTASSLREVLSSTPTIFAGRSLSLANRAVQRIQPRLSPYVRDKKATEYLEVRWFYNGSFFSSLFSAKVIHLSFDLWRQLLIPVQRANWIYLVPCRLGNLAEPSICSLNVMSMADFSGPIYLRVNIFEAISSWSSQAICWTTNYLISRGCKNKSIMSCLRWSGHQSYLRIHMWFSLHRSRATAFQLHPALDTIEHSFGNQLLSPGLWCGLLSSPVDWTNQPFAFRSVGDSKEFFERFVEFSGKSWFKVMDLRKHQIFFSLECRIGWLVWFGRWATTCKKRHKFSLPLCHFITLTHPVHVWPSLHSLPTNW